MAANIVIAGYTAKTLEAGKGIAATKRRGKLNEKGIYRIWWKKVPYFGCKIG
jgi:hypothetical protein